MHLQRPLSGIRVVELNSIGPGPFCAMVLADLGADVIRVHNVTDIGRPPNPVLDRGRRSIAVDLKQQSGRLLVRRLIHNADVLLEGYRPGVLERLGLDPTQLVKQQPSLVVARVTGYGQSGPLAHAAGHDINYLAMAGVLSTIGRPDQPPAPPLNLVADFGGGGMMAAMGIVSALLRVKSGHPGGVMDAAMIDGVSLLFSMMHGYRSAGAWNDDRGTNTLDTGAPFYEVYECADGGFIAVGAIEPQFFAKLVAGLGLEEPLADELSDNHHRDPSTWPRMRELFSAAFTSRTRDEWVAIFDGVDACVTPVLTIPEAQEHPHNIARQSYWQDASGVTHPTAAPRFTDTTEAERPLPAPRPGADTVSICRDELALTDDEIRTLHAHKAIAG